MIELCSEYLLYGAFDCMFLSCKNIQSKFLMSAHPLTNFEIQKYYQNQPKFNSAYLINNLPKVKDEPYI